MSRKSSSKHKKRKNSKLKGLEILKSKLKKTSIGNFIIFNEKFMKKQKRKGARSAKFK